MIAGSSSKLLDPKADIRTQAGRRVMGFDSWTRGAHHFERLVPELARRSIELRLVHLGSWGNDPGRPLAERIGTLEVRDIRSYGTDSLEKLLELEAPDAVVFLSIETFAHRALIRYCRARAIPTLLLYHGLVNVQVTDDGAGSYGISPRAHAAFVLSKLGKVLRRTLPCYTWALLRTRGGWGDWRRFASDCVRMVSGRTAHRLAADPDTDASTTLCAVYTEADVEHAIRCYAFTRDDVRVVGNPDLPHFGMTEQMIGTFLTSSRSERRLVTYIDTGLVNNGLVFESRAQFIAHLLRTADALAKQGFSMALKAHPSHDEAQLRADLRPADVQLVTNAGFLRSLLESCACIIEPTTLALIPGLLGMPMYFANYGQLSGLRYGPVLSSYPRARSLTEVGELRTMLQGLPSDEEIDRTRQWIRSNAGPMPLEEMPARVADAVCALWAPPDAMRRNAAVRNGAARNDPCAE